VNWRRHARAAISIPGWERWIFLAAKIDNRFYRCCRAATVREFPMSLRKPKRRKLRLTKGDENDLEPGL
jgi:hypothetical protein